jgi:hypothetical protein
VPFLEAIECSPPIAGARPTRTQRSPQNERSDADQIAKTGAPAKPDTRFRSRFSWFDVVFGRWPDQDRTVLGIGGPMREPNGMNGRRKDQSEL